MTPAGDRDEAAAGSREVADGGGAVWPSRIPRGLDSVTACLREEMTHSDLVAALRVRRPELNDSSALEWLGDDGSAALVLLAVMSSAQLARCARDLLGATLVAYIGSASSTEDVETWVAAEVEPSGETLLRLCFAYAAGGLLRDHVSAAEVQAWFERAERELGASPAHVLRMDTFGSRGLSVLVAARRFARIPL